MKPRTHREKRFIVLSVTEILGESLQEVMARSESLRRKRTAYIEVDVCGRPVSTLMGKDFAELLAAALKLESK